MIALKDIEQQLSDIRSGGFELVASNIELFSTDERYLGDYLNSLVFNNSGNQSSFPKHVMKAIIEIYLKLPEQKGRHLVLKIVEVGIRSWNFLLKPFFSSASPSS